MSERLTNFKRLFQRKSLWHVKEIENKLEIARTKVYALRDQLYHSDGISLEDNNSHPEVPRGYLKWPQSYSNHEVRLSPVEIEALKTAIEHMDAVTPLVRQALDALTKSNPIQEQLDQESIIHIPFNDNFDKTMFGRIIKAIQKRKPAQVSYLNSQGKQTNYEFYSYLIMPSNQHFHLVGMSKTSKDAGHNSINRLRIDQIQKFTILKGNFSKPNFDIEDYVNKHFGPFSSEGEPTTIKVRFSSQKAQYVRRTIRHQTQDTFNQSDGSVIWQIEAPISEYLVAWIVSYGSHAKVIEPQELKEQVKQWAKGSLDANS